MAVKEPTMRKKTSQPHLENVIYEYETICRRARVMETELDMLRRLNRHGETRHIIDQIRAQLDSTIIRLNKVKTRINELSEALV